MNLLKYGEIYLSDMRRLYSFAYLINAFQLKYLWNLSYCNNDLPAAF